MRGVRTRLLAAAFDGPWPLGAVANMQDFYRVLFNAVEYLVAIPAPRFLSSCRPPPECDTEIVRRHGDALDEIETVAVGERADVSADVPRRRRVR